MVAKISRIFLLLKVFIFTLLIGTMFAMVYAAPASDKPKSLQAVVQDDDLAKVASWLSERLAQLQEDSPVR